MYQRDGPHEKNKSDVFVAWHVCGAGFVGGDTGQVAVSSVSAHDYSKEASSTPKLAHTDYTCIFAFSKQAVYLPNMLERVDG